MFRDGDTRRAVRKGVMLFAVGLALAGCGTGVPSAGVEPGGHGKYVSIAVVPLLADEIRMESGAFMPERSPRVVTGWETRAKADAIMQEILAPVGTKVVAVHDIPALLGDDSGKEDWARLSWERLRQANRLEGVQAVLLIRQNAIDVHGRQYSPVRDFFGAGLIGLAVGAAQREEEYQPSFTLAVTSGAAAALSRGSRCNVGFDAVLLDARTGRVLGAAKGMFGQEMLPEDFQPKTWASATDAERHVAETYCIAALRRGLAKTVRKLDLVER